MTHDKPKNDASFPTGFEQAWLYRFYHVIGWERAVRLEINRPPVECLAHLRALRPQPREMYDIDWQDIDECQFKMTIMSQNRKRSGYTAAASAVITATHGAHDDDHSMIVIRVYPSFGPIAFFGFWLLLLSALVFQPGPSEKDVIIALLSGLVVFISWGMRFYQRDRLLSLMINHFDPQHADKPKNELRLEPAFARSEAL